MPQKVYEYEGLLPEGERQLLIAGLQALNRELHRGAEAIAAVDSISQLANGERQRATSLVPPERMTEEGRGLICALARKLGGLA